MKGTGGIGAAAELEVCADLMRRGFYCFRNLSPHGPVDLIAMCPSTHKLVRIQVKNATPSHRGSDHWDVLAVAKIGMFRGELKTGVSYFRCEEQPRACNTGTKTVLKEIALHPTTI